MQILLSKEELRWIDISSFGWKTKKGCPKEVKEKINLLTKYKEDVIHGRNFRMTNEKR